MPELIHGCGKRVRFPSGTEGRRGKCPHCGGRVEVPGSDETPARIMLDPPPHWAQYLAYLEDRGPPPRPLVMPSKLMLQTEADERWDRQAEVVPSKYFCPSCKERINVDQVICTKCGLDYRTGLVLGKNVRLNEKGMKYLKDIPWLEDARRTHQQESETNRAKKNPPKTKAPTRKRKRRF